MKNVNLALIGGSEVRQYTVAERLWELLSAVSGAHITYEVIPLATQLQVHDFYQNFLYKNAYRGFNIALPWKDELADTVDRIEPLSKLPVINTIYRDGSQIVGTNTDPLAAQKAVEHVANLYKCSSALVLSTNDSGLPIAYNLQDTLGIKTYVYDAAASRTAKTIVRLATLDDVTARAYDLIVNTTPLGKYYLDHGVAAFSSPLNLELLGSITHADSIIQETNYLPTHTLLVQLARSLGRKTVTGEFMLCFRANESLKRFCGISLDERMFAIVAEEIREYIAEREAAILKLSGARQGRKKPHEPH